MAQSSLAFNPGLLLATPRPVNYGGFGDLGPCLDSAGVVTGITGDFTISGGPVGGGNASCAVQSLNAVLDISWNNGNTSTLDLQSVVGALGTIAQAREERPSSGPQA